MSEQSVIARGNGRAYGDSAINQTATLETRNLNRLIAFDGTTGQLVAEAGVLLSDIITTFMPLGWFPLITPGTKFVTLGGVIAADVHGKNHHKDGSFRECLDWVDVMNSSGEVQRFSQLENSHLFDYTVGGMGLTGIVLQAAIRLRRIETAWISQTTIAAPNLKAAMAIFEDTLDATYSVAWIDCLSTGEDIGRSLIMLGEHVCRDGLTQAQAVSPFKIKSKRKLSIPFDFPSFVLNRLSVKAFNALYYWRGAKKIKPQLVDWDSYFYPLDAIHGWNRVYGRKGFAQYQCVLPLDRSKIGLTALLKEISNTNTSSFLAVLKRFGRQESAFSFPMEGYTLALDFPVSKETLLLFDRLDQLVIEHGGRFYLAKDSRMTSATLYASDRRSEDFHSLRNIENMTSRFQSTQSRRLKL